MPEDLMPTGQRTTNTYAPNPTTNPCHDIAAASTKRMSNADPEGFAPAPQLC